MPVPADITIQVLNSSGAITNVSSEADWLVPIVPVAQARALANGGGAILVRGAPFDMPSLLRVVVVPANGGQLVIAAVPFSEASGSLSVVARALVIFTPVLFLAFTGAIWLVTGSTLRPIGALRRGAARVTATGMPSDLPVPEARDEVRLLAVTLNDMLSRLAEAQQRQRALVSDTAHELRSPIASIRTQLEVALDFPATQDWATTARDVHADVLRLARLAEDLLLLARLDEQAGQAGQAGTGGPGGGMSVDLAELSRSVVCRYADTRVPVTVLVPEATAPAGSVVVAGDWARLDRLIVNLVDNAVRYAKSSVVVSVTRDGSSAELSVTDDGPGIPRPTGNGPFTALPGLTTRAAGTGTRRAAPDSGLPSSARPRRPTAARPSWNRPRQMPRRTTFRDLRRACARSSASRRSTIERDHGNFACARARGFQVARPVRVRSQTSHCRVRPVPGRRDIVNFTPLNLGAACGTVSAARSVTCGARTGPRSCGRSTWASYAAGRS